MADSTLCKHELGFLQVADKPSPQALADYYEQTYFQNESGNYRKRYSALETEVISLRIAQRAAQVVGLTGRETPGSMLDVGCGEGFAII